MITPEPPKKLILTIDNEVCSAFTQFEYGTLEEKALLFSIVGKKLPYGSMSLMTRKAILFALLPYRKETDNPEVIRLIKYLIDEKELSTYLVNNVAEYQEDLLISFCEDLDLDETRHYSLNQLKQICKISKNLANYSIKKLIEIDWIDVYEMAHIIRDSQHLGVKCLLNSKLLEDDYNVQYLMREFPELERYRSML